MSAGLVATSQEEQTRATQRPEGGCSKLKMVVTVENYDSLILLGINSDSTK